MTVSIFPPCYPCSFPSIFLLSCLLCYHANFAITFSYRYAPLSSLRTLLSFVGSALCSCVRPFTLLFSFISCPHFRLSYPTHLVNLLPLAEVISVALLISLSLYIPQIAISSLSFGDLRLLLTDFRGLLGTVYLNAICCLCQWRCCGGLICIVYYCYRCCSSDYFLSFWFRCIIAFSSTLCELCSRLSFSLLYLIVFNLALIFSLA